MLNLICRMASFEVVSLLINAGVDAERAVDILQKVPAAIMQPRLLYRIIFYQENASGFFNGIDGKRRRIGA